MQFLRSEMNTYRLAAVPGRQGYCLLRKIMAAAPDFIRYGVLIIKG
jgi:hypothetical protein